MNIINMLLKIILKQLGYKYDRQKQIDKKKGAIVGLKFTDQIFYDSDSD